MAEIRKAVLVPDRTIKPQDHGKMEVLQASIFLDLFNMCQTLKVLPKPGGLLDQDSLYVFLMRHTLVYQEAKRELDEAKRRADSA